MINRKILYFFVLLSLLFSPAFYAQTKGIAYQAVIFKPDAKSIPGVSFSTSPLLNATICLRFTFLDSVDKKEYQETITTTTDNYGIVNIVIGSGTQTGGYAASFNAISWNTNQKTIVVELDVTSTCTSFEEISNQLLPTAPFSYSAITANNITGIAAIVNGGTGANNALDARINLGLGNVNNTSDLNKPISTATQTALNLKEDVANKSTTSALGTSDVLYPTQNAVKTYVDTQVATATFADATSTIKGKIQLTGDLGGTAASPTVPGLATKENTIVAGTTAQYYRGDKTWQPLDKTAVGLGNIDNISDLNKPISTATQTALNLKEDVANKSTTTTLGTSDVLYPTQNAVKTYVDTQVATATISDATSTTKGKIQLTGDLGGTAASPIVGRIQGVPISITVPTNGQFLYFDGSSWVPTSIPAEVDGIIGNEITDVEVNGGLTRTGAGSTSSPYKLKINDGSTTGQLLTWDGTKWVAQVAVVTNWALTGNSGTNPTTNFIGTTDAQDVVVRTNNTEKVRVTSTGNVGIGNNNPTSRLVLNGPVATPFTTVSADVTLSNTHSVVKIDATLSDINITLPDPTTVTGRTYIIIKSDKTINKLLFSQTITGNEFTFTQANVPGTYQIQSDGVAWHLIN